MFAGAGDAAAVGTLRPGGHQLTCRARRSARLRHPAPAAGRGWARPGSAGTTHGPCRLPGRLGHDEVTAGLPGRDVRAG
jgi:hypothetical protein